MEHSRLLLPLLSIAFCWLVFFHALYKGKQRNSLAFTACPDQSAVAESLKLHFTGILWMGLIPFLLYKTVLSYVPDAFVIVLPRKLEWWILLPISIMVITGLHESLKQIASSHLPATNRSIILYSGLRIVYIISYEQFFRGWILFESLKLLSPAPAIFLNTFLYFLYHFFSDRKELVGTILLGPLLCFISLKTGSALGAVLIHLALTVSYEAPLLIHKIKSTKTTI